MKSPITGSDNCKLVQTFNVDKIINLYNKELSIDVSRFFTTVKEVSLYECIATGYKFYYPYDIFGDGAFYSELNDKHKGYYIEERWEHTQSLKLLTAGMNVLEIGSGDGHFLKLMKNKSINATGLELNEDAVKHSTDEGLTVLNELIDKHAENNQHKYDAVCFFQVLEHISDVKDFLESAISTLKTGGLLIIGVPNNNPYIFKHDVWHTLNLPPHHAGLWSKQSFEKIPGYFSITTRNISIEPLLEYKTWFEVQKKYHLSRKNKITGILLSLVPRPLYKLVLPIFKNNIDGRNILAVFSKK